MHTAFILTPLHGRAPQLSDTLPFPSSLQTKKQEHLLIVTELLRDSLFQFYRYIDASDERGVGCYFTPPTIANIAGQLLHGLDFLHSIGRTLSIAPNDQKDAPFFSPSLSILLSFPLSCVTRLTALTRREQSSTATLNPRMSV